MRCEVSESSTTPAIDTRGLGKTYELYARPEDRLKQFLWPGRGRKFYREFVALRDIDLRVGRGECVGVVGRNGSGKSTLLNMICGTLEPTAGELQVRGRVAPMLTLGAGFSPEFSGRENVRLNATVLGLSSREIEERMQSIIDFADIGEFFDQPVKCYSSGMYSRLAFAVAINVDPEILVMDEVLAVGDEAFTRKCFARIEEIKGQGATIFFASHASNLVIELCDRAILMDRGECLLQSDPKTVVAQYQRLLYVDPSDEASLRDEIRSAADVTVDAVASDDVAVPRIDYGRFDPELRPESTVEYGIGTARIRHVRILDPDGVAVNVLRADAEYRFCYEVDFDEDAHQARFGMLLKLVSGFELAGQVSHPTGEALEKVAGGMRVFVEFSFTPRLVAGTYFLNAGVLAQREGEELYLHRIVDALMFRVMPEAGSRITGQADLAGSRPPSLKLAPAKPR